MEIECGNSGVGVLGKAVGYALTEVVGYVGTAIDGESVFGGAIGAEVVDTADMVVVAVGENECFQFGAVGIEHLPAEVGPAIDEYVFTANGDER